VEIPVEAEQPRFITDAMLGRLARWLRTLGYDTAYDDAIPDGELVRRAFKDGRHILTRDRRLFDEWRIEGGRVIEAERPLEQLSEVVAAFDLPRPTRLFTRCRVCNALVQRVERSAVAGRVPPRVWERESEFAECPSCGRVYWEGSHAQRMRSVLQSVFGS
jgi:uncharacterized protein